MVFSEVDIDITDTEEVIVLYPDYIEELDRLLQKTSPRSVSRCRQEAHEVAYSSLHSKMCQRVLEVLNQDN